MEKQKKLCFVCAMLLLLPMILMLAACDFHKERNLSEDEIKGLLNQTVSLDNVSMCMPIDFFGMKCNITLETKLNKNDFVYHVKTDAGKEVIDTYTFKLDDNYYKEITINKDDKGNIVSSQSTKCLKESILPITNEFSVIGGNIYDSLIVKALEENDIDSSLYQPKLSGQKKKDGSFEIVSKVGHINKQFLEEKVITILLNSNKKITSIDIKTNLLEGYKAENFDVYSSDDVKITFNYDFDITLPNNIKDTDVVEGDFSFVVSESLCGNDALTSDRELIKTTKGQIVTLPCDITYNGDANVEFLGWYYDKELNMPVKENKVMASTKAEENVTKVYPKWNFSKPLIELNGGYIENIDKLNYLYKLSDLYDLDVLKNKYTFDGWYLDSDLTQKIEKSNNTKISKDTKVFAKFLKDIVVTFDAGDLGYKYIKATYELSPLAVNVLNENAFYKYYKQGYAIEGYYYDDKYKTKYNGEVINKDTVFYAKFVEGYKINISYPENLVSTNLLPKFVYVDKNITLEQFKNYNFNIDDLVVINNQLFMFDDLYVDNQRLKSLSEVKELQIEEGLTIYAKFNQL